MGDRLADNLGRFFEGIEVSSVAQSRLGCSSFSCWYRQRAWVHVLAGHTRLLTSMQTGSSLCRQASKRVNAARHSSALASMHPGASR